MGSHLLSSDRYEAFRKLMQNIVQVDQAQAVLVEEET
jgi:hypothetical protein